MRQTIRLRKISIYAVHRRVHGLPRTKAEVEAGHSHLPMTVEQACDALQQMVAGGGGRKQKKTLSHLALTVLRPELGPKDYEAYVSIQKGEFYLYTDGY